MVNLFLEEKEKQNVKEWTYNVVDNSISTKLLGPLWNYLVLLVPHTIAPNLLSLAGLLCILHAFYIVITLIDTPYRAFAAGAAGALIFIYQNLDAIDGKHARQTGNSSPLGELFDHACDNVGVVFIILTIFFAVGVEDTDSLWFIVQGSQMMFLRGHLKAWYDEYRSVHFKLLSGPGEALLITEFVLIYRALFGLGWLTSAASYVVVLFTDLTTQDEKAIAHLLSDWIPRIWYYTQVILLLYRIVTFPRELRYRDPFTQKLTGDVLRTKATKWGLSIILVYRIASSVLLWLPLGPFSEPLSIWDVASDGSVMAIVTSDIILAKMAKRNLHPWVPIMYMVSFLNRLLPVCLVLFYFSAVFAELCAYLNLPLLTVCRNVYCDGIYDLCHNGHKQLFKNALKLGNRLFVGIVGDEDAMKYKRPPIMSMEERAVEVMGCKGVDRVIKNCPCFGITKKFILENNIHVVAHGAEYTAREEAKKLRVAAERLRGEKKEEEAREAERTAAEEEARAAAHGEKALSARGMKYYKEAFDMGRTEILPRTEGISTTELILRCKKVHL
mmetsp:Transcript_11113/g.34070  ORF Transcript_11113/g.34070 Transcript_11113/m.34070 type:complete len:556 (+) Transcript_11113:114-1781(+)|eukprot:CAMPEP_0198728158 /NCGR_PEP_ID=MMETSP1475-20131203/7509_1 /TAXON_ID= ORGANISM="Unidentified sp., Strain CCMP1999" /NCGR_SAMPLE_ID=MMETSP1475 /ASSEMBLY_ACC=CAM_ASM_001111 /LENGTH=555 /DNA_ID=CAMNT_0044490445 /DNA_START=72 /DNA_END=1739 /DNA_ORIENTATION=+